MVPADPNEHNCMLQCFIFLYLQMLYFVADTTKIGLEAEQHLLHPRENSITALNLNDGGRGAEKSKQRT